MSGDHSALLSVGLNAESLADADENGSAALQGNDKGGTGRRLLGRTKAPHGMTGKQNRMNGEEPASSVLTVESRRMIKPTGSKPPSTRGSNSVSGSYRH